MSGSTAALLTSVEPDIVRSAQGETSHAHPGSSSWASRRRLINARVSPAPALSPTVETTPVAAPAPSASLAAATESAEGREASALAQPSASVETALATPPALPAASATPATALAPARIRDVSRPSVGETLSRAVPDRQTLLVVGLVLAGLGLLAWVIVPELRRWIANVSVYRSPTPAVGLNIENGNGNGAAPAQAAIMKNRFVGGPRQVSLQLKASEPSLRRSVRPVAKTPVRSFAPAPTFGTGPAMPAPAAESSVQRAEPEFELSPLPETSLEAVGPVVEQGAFAPTAETTPNGEVSSSAARRVGTRSG